MPSELAKLNDEIRRTPGLKQRDLKACAICGQGLMHNNQPHFYQLSVSQYVIDMRAVGRQHGLEMMLGDAAALAQALGPDDDMAKRVAHCPDLNVCADCALGTAAPPIAMLMDAGEG